MADMDALIFNRSWQLIAVIDIYESFIWTERYFEAGDFELYLPASDLALEVLVRDNYVGIRGSDVRMIIETVNITTDVEQGTKIKVTGRSLESILDRRVIWEEESWTTGFQNGVELLLQENATSPSNGERKIPGLIFKASTDSRITSINYPANLYGENLYNAMVNMCTENNIGFKIRLDESNQMVFELYKGLDRTFDQTDRPYVIFSPEYDNLLTSEYMETNEKVKNCALVSYLQRGRVITVNAGTDREQDISIPDVNVKTEVKSEQNYASGLDRREIFVETQQPSDPENPEEVKEFEEQIKSKGKEELAETNTTVMFDTTVEASRQFVYGTDFTIGDVVQIKNEFGKETKARITELIRSLSSDGYQVNPTFAVIEYKQPE